MMRERIAINILFLFLFFSILPFIAVLLFGETSGIGLAPFFLSLFAVKMFKLHKKESEFIRVVFLALVAAFLIGIFCMWGFVFLPKLVLGSSPLILNGKWIYIYWISQFCLISMSSITYYLLDWKGDPKLSRRVGVIGIILGILIFILLASTFTMIVK